MWRRVLLLSGLWFTGAIFLTFTGRVDNLLADDAYYYFEIARNAATGQGFTFDSLATTNGFHALWAWFLVVVFRLFPASYWLPIHIALGFSALCVTASGLLLYRLFARRGAPLAGEIATCAWLCNPFTVTLGFRGLEQPLNVLLLMLSISMWDGVRQRARYAPAELFGLGVAIGGAILARTDNVLWLGAVGCVLVWDLWRRRAHLGLPSRVLSFAAGALVSASPWFLWNLLTFGTLVQTSVDAKRIFRLYGDLPPILSAGSPGLRTLWELPYGAARNLLLAAQSCFRFATVEEWKGAAIANRLAVATAAYAAVVIVLALKLRRRPAGERGPLQRVRNSIGASIGAFIALHFVVYVYVVGSYSNWYFLPPVLVASLALGLSLAWVSSLGRRAQNLVLAAHVVGFVAVSLVTTRGHFATTTESRHREYRDLGGAIPKGARIGLWNAGELAYFFSFYFPEDVVINLDGVVNNEVTRAAHEERYEEYVLKHVDVIVESPSKFRDVLSPQRADAFVARHVRIRGRAGGRAVSVIVP